VSDPSIPSTATEVQRLRHFRTVLANRQAELEEMARRSTSPSARAAYARVCSHIARAVAEAGPLQTLVASEARAEGGGGVRAPGRAPCEGVEPQAAAR
jgi:hypothetical protein